MAEHTNRGGEIERLSLDLTRFERTEQRQRFDAIDAKAAALLGFSATVVALLGTAALTDELWWALAFLPAACAAAHVMYHAYQVVRIIDVQTTSPRNVRESMYGTEYDPTQYSLGVDLRLLEGGEQALRTKSDELELAQKSFAVLAYLLVGGVTIVLLGRVLALGIVASGQA